MTNREYLWFMALGIIPMALWMFLSDPGVWIFLSVGMVGYVVAETAFTLYRRPCTYKDCCSGCKGAGGTSYGPCWDCRGTGHAHAQPPNRKWFPWQK